MKAQSQQQPAALGANVLSSILSFGTALLAAFAKVLTTNRTKTASTYSVDEIVQMDSPRMQRALKLVSAINACENARDIKFVRNCIENFNIEYPEPNPLMSFLENKAWDVMACQHINNLKAKQQELREEMGSSI